MSLAVEEQELTGLQDRGIIDGFVRDVSGDSRWGVQIAGTLHWWSTRELRAFLVGVELAYPPNVAPTGEFRRRARLGR